ncbi:MAG: DUF2207 domain-containing protein [Bacillota bacterium]|nr:DUF2207 domain-containing protein [Bacillota bacterium]
MMAMMTGRPHTRKPGVMAVVLATLVASAVLWVGQVVQARELSLSNVNIEARVERDGSLIVREERTFRFDGEFSRVRQWIPIAEGVRVTDIAVSEGGKEYTLTRGSGDERVPGTYRVEEAPDGIEIAWHFKARDESRTFTLGYRIRGAVVSHNDVAELYWKCVGDQWDVGAPEAHVAIALPAGARKDDIKAWAHGPLWGAISIESPTLVTLSVAPLPAKTFVEARVVFPKAIVPAATRTSGRNALAPIMEEERALAREANIARERAAERQAALRRLGRLNVYLAPGVVLLVLALWFGFVYRRYDREYVPEFSGDYYRELPAMYTPAELGVLWRFGSPGPADFTATVMDLARRGYLSIEERRTERKRLLGLLGTAVEVEYVIKRTDKGKDDDLLEHEKALYNLLFYTVGDNQVVTFDEIEAYAKKHPGPFLQQYNDWQAKVRADAGRNDFFDRTAATGRLIGILTGIGLILAGVGAIVVSVALAPSGIAWIVTGIMVVVISAAIKRRSQKGQTEFAMWRAFRRFLLDFSSLHDAPVPALVLWEHYLVYAVTLGVAKQVIDQLRLVFPELSEPGSGLAIGHGWLMASSATDLASTLTNLTTSLERSLLTATSVKSSESGGGGGFSGGGGGGIGGGGGSAD